MGLHFRPLLSLANPRNWRPPRFRLVRTLKQRVSTQYPALVEEYRIRTNQEPLTDADVKTTMIYTHLASPEGRGVNSLVDNR